jgi:metallo-beta-lactamase class B
MTFNRIAGVFAAAVVPCMLLAQAPPAEPAKPDSPQVKSLIEKAKKVAGSKWADEAHFFCEAPRANRADDPLIPPTEIFDGVYILGNAGTVAYVIKTSAGLMMIDAMGANQVDTQVLPAFQKLGLNPADVKIIVMGHGHADHFGGSPYFQDHYGSKVYISTADWDMMEHPPAGRGGDKKKGPPQVLPKHDADVKEGEPIVLGDFKLMPVAIPGHTPGAMGYIFAIKDNGKPHVAALYGGTVLTPGPVSTDNLKLYVQSVKKFEVEAKKAKVDSILQNHPLMYPLPAMLDQLQSRKKGGPNPFIVGQGEYQKFLQTMEVCSEANVARREE